MVDLIDRQMAIDAIADHLKAFTSNRPEYNMARRHMMELLAVLPAADVVERKKGKWLDMQFFPDGECSVCHRTSEVRTNYCPYCGADMREATT